MRVIESPGHDIFLALDQRESRAGEQGAMRRGGTTTGALAAWLRRAAPGWRRPAALVPLTAPLLAFLVVNRSWPGVVAMAMAGLVLLAACGPVTVLGLLPLSLLGGVVPGRTTVTLGAIGVVTLVTGVQVLAGRRRLRPPHLWMLFFGMLVLLAYVFPAFGPGGAPDRLSDLICLLAGLGLTAAVTASPPSPRVATGVTAAVGAAAAGWVLLAGHHADGRLEGLGLNPNYLGAFLALPLVAAVGLARHRHRPAWLLPAAVCLAAMVATESRGAFAAGAAGVALVLIQGRRRRIQALIVIAVIAFGTAFPGLVDAAEHVAAGGRRAAELSEDSSIRAHVAWCAAKVAVQHPLRGLGYGMFPSYAENSPQLGIYIATHNDYLRLAAETGILSLITFLALIWLAMKGRGSAEPAVSRAVVAAYAVGLLFANELANLVVSMPFWLALGCLLAAPDQRENHITSAQGVQQHDRQPGRGPHR
jgi:O-antigen ligase